VGLESMSKGYRAGRHGGQAGPDHPVSTSATERARDVAFDRALAVHVKALGLPDFETRADCEGRQADTLRRVGDAGVPPALWQDLADCTVNHCGMETCVEVCHFGTINRRVAALATGLPLMDRHAGPHFAVTIVHPLWEVPVGRLTEINIAAAAQWNHRRLRGAVAAPGLLAMGSFEVSLNRELDGRLIWAGEIQQMVAGASYEELRSTFSIERHYRDGRPGQRMVDVREFDDLNRKFSYGQKRLVEERRAYISKITGRQARNHLPPAAEHWAEFDTWLLGLPLGARIIAYGCNRRGTAFSARKPNSI
jgi:hypothetical protein